MASSRSVAVGTISVCAVICGLTSQRADGQALLSTASPRPTAESPRNTAPAVLLGTGVRSMHIMRSGEILRSRPDANSPRRGTAQLNAYLPAHEAALGPGCASRWVRVGTRAWVCQGNAEPSPNAPNAQQLPVVPTGQWLPYQYLFAAFAGVQTYRTQEDALHEDWAEQLERSMGVAVTQVTRFGGKRWALTAAGRWISHEDLIPARPSEFQGALIDQSIPSADRVGFAKRRSYLWPSAEMAIRGGRIAPRESVQARELLVALETAVWHGHTAWRTPRGWIDARQVHFTSVVDPPANLRANERWVDIETSSQSLVAYEGTRPVYTTVIASGRRGFETRRGEFRAWVKLATTDMSNADDPDLDTSTRVYSVERVPWVIFFHGDQALHGVYWHDRFGTARSHGCVNLAPRDARWIFEWAPPALPAGWEAVFPTEDEPGLRVRVR